MNRFYRFIHLVIAPFIRLFCPMRVVGRENIPQGGALICPNHSNAADPILVAVAMGRQIPLRFMAKEQLFRFPPLGWLLRGLGAFPVNRGGSDLGAIKTSMKCLQEGEKLMLFPEGTRVEQEGEASAKGGASMLATRANVPIVPVNCGGKHKFLRRNTIIFGEPYRPVIAGRRPTNEENQQIAAELLRRIYALGATKK